MDKRQYLTYPLDGKRRVKQLVLHSIWLSFKFVSNCRFLCCQICTPDLSERRDGPQSSSLPNDKANSAAQFYTDDESSSKFCALDATASDCGARAEDRSRRPRKGQRWVSSCYLGFARHGHAPEMNSTLEKKREKWVGGEMEDGELLLLSKV